MEILTFLSAFKWWQILILILTTVVGLITIVLIASKQKFKIKTNFMEIGSSSPKGLIPSEHRDYLIFSLVLFRFMSQIKDFLRVGCIQNGFHLMLDSDWLEYKKEKFQILGTKAQKYFGENLRGLSVIEIVDESILSDLLPQVKDQFNQLYDMLRDISKEQYGLISKKSQELHDYYETQKDKIMSNSCLERDILYILLDYGQKMVEIHEIKTRNLIDLQMNRVEEKLSFISDLFLNSFLERLSEKLNK